MTTKVISAFPGTGKSHFASTTKQCVFDLDTGDYTQGYTDDGKVRNSDFPDNYTLAIKEQIGKVDVLLVGCQPEVIAALRKEGVSFTLVYPDRKLKDEYVSRFRARHSPRPFIGLLSKNWDLFLDFLEGQKDCKRIVLDGKQYIGNVIDAGQ
jgi:hypothetical protein